MLNIRGLLLWRYGNHEEALDHLHNSLNLSDQIDNKQFTALSLFIIGIIWQSQGRINKSEKILQESLDIYSSFNFKIGQVYCLNALGINHYTKGELHSALNYFLEALEIHREIGNKQYIAYSYDNIGLVYESLGDDSRAHQFLNNAIRLRRDIGNDFETAISLYNYVRHGLRHDDLEDVKQQLEELKLIAELNNNPLLQLRADMAEALYYRELPGMEYTGQAKEIFKRIISEKIINFELTMHAMLNYCDLLFLELKLSQDDEIISEIKGLLGAMQSMAEMYQSFSILVEVMILQAKLSLIEGNIIDAQNQLEQARAMADDMKLSYLSQKVESELDDLRSQFLHWKKLVETNASIVDKMESSSVIDYLSSISRINLNANVPEQYGDAFKRDVNSIKEK